MFRRLLFDVQMSFRIWMRNRTRPMTIMEAEEKKLFWAKVYMFCGFAGLIYATNSALKNSSTDVFSQNIPISKRIFDKMDDKAEFRVLRFSGFKKTSDVVMSKEDAIRERDVEVSKEASHKVQ